MLKGLLCLPRGYSSYGGEFESTNRRGNWRNVYGSTIIITILIITVYSIKAYIKSNIKNIVVRTIEGLSLYENLKVLYLVIIFQVALVIVFVFIGKASLLPSFLWIIIEILITSRVSRKMLKQNLSEFMKGNQ